GLRLAPALAPRRHGFALFQAPVRVAIERHHSVVRNVVCLRVDGADAPGIVGVAVRMILRVAVRVILGVAVISAVLAIARRVVLPCESSRGDDCCEGERQRGDYPRAPNRSKLGQHTNPFSTPEHTWRRPPNDGGRYPNKWRS